MRVDALPAVLVAVVALGACEAAQPPAACDPIPQVTIHTGETDAVTACFNDPNGDVLTYSAVSSNSGVATVSISGTNVTVTAVSPGSASITLKARDPGVMEGQQNFDVVVPNRAPQPAGAVAPATISVGQSEATDVSSYFTEPDGQALAYAATSSSPSRATVSVSGSVVTVTGVAKGAATVTVTATDTEGLSAEQGFQVTVPNRAPVAVGELEDLEVEVDASAELDVAVHFTDPDGDALAYAATSSNPAMVSTSVSGSVVMVTAIAKGTATVTVSATDTEGLSAELAFQMTVPNRAPTAVGEVEDLEVAVDSAAEVDASEYFEDPDGDALTYAATSSDFRVAAVAVSGGWVTVTGVAKGAVTVRVTATDPGELSAEQSFQVTVTLRDFDLGIGFTSGVPSSVRSDVREARDEWELALEETELADVSFDSTITCLGLEGHVGTVDDHLIWVHVDGIDGEGGVLARVVSAACRQKAGRQPQDPASHQHWSLLFGWAVWPLLRQPTTSDHSDGLPFCLGIPVTSD